MTENMKLNIGGVSGRMMLDENKRHIATAGTPGEAAHIVKCVNMHDELVEALKEIMSEYATIVSNNFSQDVRLGGDDTYDLCVSALKKEGAL